MDKGRSIFSIFKKRSGAPVKAGSGLPTAVAFVDYEHWFISMEKQFGEKPDIQAWFDDLKTKCNITEVVFFANFSKFRDKETETRRIRSFTNKIIDTYNPDQRYVKDYTDFIILDNIYQEAFHENSPEMFIIFTGDGHFSSAVAFLRNFCKKQVGVYGVAGCISKNLINGADWYVEFPIKVDENAVITKALFSYLKDAEKNVTFFPTFMHTAEEIAIETGLPQEKVTDVLADLIKQGFITQEMKKTTRGKPIKVLVTDWDLVSRKGIWA